MSALLPSLQRVGVPALAHVLHGCGDKQAVGEWAALALSHLARHSARGAAAVAAAGCIPRLVQLLQASGMTEGQVSATARALANAVTSSPAGAAAVEAAGGRAALRRHVDSGNEDVARALRLLAEHAQQEAVPPPQPVPRVCAAGDCLNTAHLRRCGGCGRVHYCSVECSKAHPRRLQALARRRGGRCRSAGSLCGGSRT